MRSALFLVAVVAVASHAAPLDPTAARCAHAKRSAAAKTLARLLRCDATTVATSTIDPGCDAAAHARLARRWPRIDRRLGCPPSTDVSAVTTIVDAGVGDVEGALGLGGPSACIAGKYKSLSRDATCIARCVPDGGSGPDEACASRCEAAFAGDCRAAEDEGICRAAGNCDVLADVVARTTTQVATALPAATSPPCGHDTCQPGVALDPRCADPCVAAICAVDPYCCALTWDQRCVDETASVCGVTCPTCGDGRVEGFERCDPPFAACFEGAVCTGGCDGCVAVCGDSIIGPGEACDPPFVQGICRPGEVCTETCLGCQPVCGDGVLGPGEACDPPLSPGTCPAGETCKTDCSGCGVNCGDGVRGAGEVCEFFSPSQADACPIGTYCTNCRSCDPSCADGYVVSPERCDPPQERAQCAAGQVCAPDCGACAACPDSSVIPPDGGSATGALSGTASRVGQCGGSFAAEEVFLWTPGTSGPAVVDTCGGTTDYDPELYVLEADCGGPLIGRFPCSGSVTDDGCGTGDDRPRGTRIVRNVDAGTTYAIVVEGSPFGAPAGHFSLTVGPCETCFLLETPDQNAETFVLDEANFIAVSFVLDGPTTLTTFNVAFDFSSFDAVVGFQFTERIGPGATLADVVRDGTFFPFGNVELLSGPLALSAGEHHLVLFGLPGPSSGIHLVDLLSPGLNVSVAQGAALDPTVPAASQWSPLYAAAPVVRIAGTIP